jgi:hypothetical protein
VVRRRAPGQGNGMNEKTDDQKQSETIPQRMLANPRRSRRA